MIMARNSCNNKKRPEVDVDDLAAVGNGSWLCVSSAFFLVPSAVLVALEGAADDFLSPLDLADAAMSETSWSKVESFVMLQCYQHEDGWS